MENNEAPNKQYFEDTVSTISQNIKDTAGNITQQATEVAKKSIDYYTSKTIVIVGLFFVLILAIFVAYGLYILISASIFNQSKNVIEKTRIPILCNTGSKFLIETFNKTGNGKRRSYTFWIYINDLTKYSGSYKHVWHIGSQGDIRDANPYIFLDKEENKLYVRFASIDKTTDSFTKVVNSVQSFNQTDLNDFMQQGIVIPYIPLQRWVHIAIVVNENSNGGTIVAYVDGDISKIVTTGEIRENNKSLILRNLDLDKMGDLYVGGNMDSNYGVGFSGLIAKVALYNYDLNDKDIYKDYNEGPLSGFLASLGLSNYGLRSPIYKIT